jgi:hypothetical protein
MGGAIVAAIHPCDFISATVMPCSPSAYGQLYRAIGVTDLESGGGLYETRVPRKPIARILGPVALHATGRIAHWLVDEGGEVSGFILTDGAQVHIDPETRNRVMAHLQSPADELVVMGRGVSGAFGVTLALETLFVNSRPVPLSSGDGRYPPVH